MAGNACRNNPFDNTKRAVWACETARMGSKGCNVNIYRI